VLTKSLTEIKFVADESLLKKLERVQQVSGHVLASASMAEMISKLADEYLKKHDFLLKIKKSFLNDEEKIQHKEQ
jgi:hypothetical protein